MIKQDARYAKLSNRYPLALDRPGQIEIPGASMPLLGMRKKNHIVNFRFTVSGRGSYVLYCSTGAKGGQVFTVDVVRPGTHWFTTQFAFSPESKTPLQQLVEGVYADEIPIPVLRMALMFVGEDRAILESWHLTIDAYDRPRTT